MSPEIPDRGETSGIPDIFLGAKHIKKSNRQTTYKYIKNIVPAKGTGVSDNIIMAVNAFKRLAYTGSGNYQHNYFFSHRH